MQELPVTARYPVAVTGWWAASYVALWILVVVLAVVVVALARQIGTLHLRLGPRGALEIDDEGPPLGEAPEPLEVRDVSGRHVTVGGPGTSQLLLFVSPACRVCKDVLPALPAAARTGELAPVVITDEDAGAAAAGLGNTSVGGPLISSPETAQTYRIPGTPYMVVLDDFGVVRAKGTVNNLEQMEGLVDTARRRTLHGDAGHEPPNERIAG
jgi:methylamine dehydrogenase accessory protein MauD